MDPFGHVVAPSSHNHMLNTGLSPLYCSSLKGFLIHIEGTTTNAVITYPFPICSRRFWKDSVGPKGMPCSKATWPIVFSLNASTYCMSQRPFLVVLGGGVVDASLESVICCFFFASTKASFEWRQGLCRRVGEGVSFGYLWKFCKM